MFASHRPFLIAFFTTILAAAYPLWAYIDAGGTSITLPEMCMEFRRIAVVKVAKLDPQSGATLLQVVQVIQGQPIDEPIRQALRNSGKPAPIVAHLKVGDELLLFTDCYDHRSVTLTADGWYLTGSKVDGWEFWKSYRPDLEAVYSGTPKELATTIQRLRRGETVLCPTRPDAATKTAAFHLRYSFDWPHRRQTALGPNMSAADRTVEQWTKDLASDEPVTRYNAATALAQSGISARHCVPQLVQLLSEKHLLVRFAAASALGTLHTDADVVVPKLSELLRDKDRFMSTAAAVALREYGRDALPALEALDKARDHNQGVYDYRPLRLGEISETILMLAPDSPQAKRALNTLKNLLRDDRQDNDGTRVAGARAMARCGRAASAALPALLERLHDKQLPVRVAAAEAILRIDPESAGSSDAINMLRKGLDTPDVLDCIQTIRSIGRVGPVAKQLVPDLRRLRDDRQEPEIRETIDRALHDLGVSK